MQHNLLVTKQVIAYEVAWRNTTGEKCGLGGALFRKLVVSEWEASKERFLRIITASPRWNLPLSARCQPTHTTAMVRYTG